MRVIVYPHTLGMGGSQLNAIEIAAATRDASHEMSLYGRRGVLNSRIEQLSLEFVQSPPPGRRPSVVVVRDLRALLKQRCVDIADVDLDVPAFCQAHRIPHAACHVVTVSRLAHELKLEGVLLAIDVVPTLGNDVVLTTVGSGPAEGGVRRAAERANEQASRRAVVLTGDVMESRPAYRLGDIVLGMGGSALRALALAKPLVVQGERGFWRTLKSEILSSFGWAGSYGVGSGSLTGAEELRRELTPLLGDRAQRGELEEFGRRLMVGRYSLDAAVCRQLETYEKAKDRRPVRHLQHDLRAAGQLTAHTLRRKARRLRGGRARDDLNATPVAATYRGGTDGQPDPTC